MNIDFDANKTPTEIIKKRGFGGNYFREVFLVLMVNGTESHGKDLMNKEVFITLFIINHLLIIKMTTKNPGCSDSVII